MRYKADTIEAVIAALAAIGIEWNGQDAHIATEYQYDQQNSCRIDIAFLGSIPVPDSDPVEFLPGYHFDVLCPVPLQLNETVQEVTPENPYHTFAL